MGPALLGSFSQNEESPLAGPLTFPQASRRLSYHPGHGTEATSRRKKKVPLGGIMIIATFPSDACPHLWNLESEESGIILQGG